MLEMIKNSTIRMLIEWVGLFLFAFFFLFYFVFCLHVDLVGMGFCLSVCLVLFFAAS